MLACNEFMLIFVLVHAGNDLYIFLGRKVSSGVMYIPPSTCQRGLKQSSGHDKQKPEAPDGGVLYDNP